MGWGVRSLAGPCSLGLNSITWTDGGRKQLWLRDIQRSQRASYTVAMTQPQDGGWEQRKLDGKQWRVSPGAPLCYVYHWATSFHSSHGAKLTISPIPHRKRRTSTAHLPFLPISFSSSKAQNQSNNFLPKTTLTSFLWYLQAPKI